VGAILAMAAAFLLGFVPRLPSSDASSGLGLTSSGVRITGATKRRLRVFAVIQIAASFVLLAGAGMLLKTLLSLQAVQPGFETARVLAVNVPILRFGRTQDQINEFYRQLQERVAALPGVENAALGSTVPWRDGGGSGFSFALEGKKNADPHDDPRARARSASPGFFATLGIPVLAGREFTAADRSGSEQVVIISESIAKQLFPGQDPLNRQLAWTDGIMKFIGVATTPRRIVGVVGDIDDEHIDPAPAMAVYQPVDQEGGNRLFVRIHAKPYSLVPAITRLAHELSPDQPVENAATLEDVRAEVLTPERLNTIVFGGFSIVALAISIVGVAGVLAFSVSSRTREFGIRLAMGSQPRRLLAGVLIEGMLMAGIGVVSGGIGGLVLSRVVSSFLGQVTLPGVLPISAAAAVLIVAACVASLLPAGRAARVDVIQALRSE
jgi:predicted permease